MTSLQTLHGTITLPTFFPDGTRGVVKGVDSTDLERCKVEGLVINTYHLILNNVSNNTTQLEEIHQFMQWNHPIITDSGGFQVMSWVHNNPGLGKIEDQGVTFKLNKKQNVLLTSELSIRTQLSLGADIVIVLDDCTKPDVPLSEQEESVRRTILWAKKSKEEYIKLTQGKSRKPLIFGVVQGGNSKKLRKRCAEELIKIGFDGYCYGGFLVNEKGQFMSKMVEYVAKLLPNDKPKYLLGAGKPENIVECVKFGYQIFDCVIPTREARHKKLYIFNKNPQDLDLNQNFYTNLNFQQAKMAKDTEPVSKFCDCLTCQNYSRAYLHYLFSIGDMLAMRLATIHNLRFYTMLMERLKVKLRTQ